MGKFSNKVIARNKAIMSVGRKIKKNNSKFNIGCFDCTECHCCKNNISIDISYYENKLLKTLIKPIHKEQAILAKASKEETGRYNCPFLIEGRCSIYELRPLACSTYMVLTDNPDGCIVGEEIVKRISPVDIVKNIDLNLVLSDKRKRYDLLDVF